MKEQWRRGKLSEAVPNILAEARDRTDQSTPTGQNNYNYLDKNLKKGEEGVKHMLGLKWDDGD